MSILVLTLESADPVSNVENLQVNTGKHAAVQKVVDYVQRVNSGMLPASSDDAISLNIAIQDNMTPATGTFTLASVVATDACSINGVTFSCVSSGATGNQFNVGADDDETAENLANAINNSATALVNTAVVASVAANVVSLTSKIWGVAGNWITIASADATITASGARLESGAVDSGALTLTF